MTGAQAADLAILAGTGDLPKQLAESCARNGRRYIVVEIEGTPLNWTAGHPAYRTPVEKPGRLIKHLKKNGFGAVVFAGAMNRPEINPVKLDMLGAKLAASVLTGTRKGDDAVLREVARLFENAGFTMEAAHEVLPALLPPAGTLGKRRPSDVDMKDAARAAELVQALGRLDVGQGAVVVRGLCLGLETLQGTDRMLEFVAATRQVDTTKNGRGVLLKAPKPGQDLRFDLPAIGIETLRKAHAAGLAGVAIAAGGVMVLRLDEVVAEADRLGLFLWCRPEE